MQKLTYLFFLLFFLYFPNVEKSFSSESLYILIDKATNQLKVMEKEKVLAVYEVGWGLKSELPKQKKGDFLTPEGMYEISSIKPSSRYLYFIELNYPNLNDLAWAYYNGWLTTEEFEILKEFFLKKRKIVSSLGTEIGIHGGGAFKEEKKEGQVYKNYNWTQGCVSLFNKDLLSLLKFINIKQKVFIINSSKNLYEILEKLVYPKNIKPLEIFEGEVYFKLDQYTYYKFNLKKYFNGKKSLNFQEWHKGHLVNNLDSKTDGTFEPYKEKEFKNLVLSKIYLIENF